ncbi:MAG: septum formation initiator [Flavobacteriales bacterium]|nr:septum formation initiator [Flavobacteriales bacterium]
MYIINKISKILTKKIKNKYIVTILIFIIWIFFLDDYSLIKQRKIENQIKKLKTQKEYYINEIQKDSIELNNLKTNPAEQEKFAREKFLMKKENEDVFIIKKKNE